MRDRRFRPALDQLCRRIVPSEVTVITTVIGNTIDTGPGSDTSTTSASTSSTTMTPTTNVPH